MIAAKVRPQPAGRLDIVVVVHGDVLVRTSVAEYLRACKFRVLETRDADEALVVLQGCKDQIHTVLSDGPNGFVLSRWVKEHRPGIKIIHTATLERAAQAAADLCEKGPAAKRPYDPQLLIQQIKAALAKAEQ
jgi:DNA-binding NtrC family response regulator